MNFIDTENKLVPAGGEVKGWEKWVNCILFVLV